MSIIGKFVRLSPFKNFAAVTSAMMVSGVIKIYHTLEIKDTKNYVYNDAQILPQDISIIKYAYFISKSIY